MINYLLKLFLVHFWDIRKHKKEFRCYDIKNDKLYVSRNVTFLENISGFEEHKTHEDNVNYSFLFELLSRNEDFFLVMMK